MKMFSGSVFEEQPMFFSQEKGTEFYQHQE